MTNNKKTTRIILIAALVILAVATVVYGYSNYKSEKKSINSTAMKSNSVNTDSQDVHAVPEIDTNFLTAATIYGNDSTIEPVRVSDSASNITTANTVSAEPKYAIDDNAGNTNQTVFTGKRINIAITGLDGRVGAISRHADANHVISILVDSGKIEITSIPRDTYCDLGYDDTTGLNKLTICRSNKGRTKYLKEVARIARVDKIHYYVEFGFSQAMGMIEWLGYKDPANTLQVLRNRKGLGGDDYQRCYNQGQFIRQAILAHFSKFTGTLGPVFIRGGLMMVETNMSYDVASDIVNKLDIVNFSKEKDDIVVKVRPPIKINYKVYDFADQGTVDNMIEKMEKFNNSRFKQNIESPQPVVNVEKRLNNLLNEAVKDTAKNPNLVINKLSACFEQRAWYQVENKQERDKIRDRFGAMLYSAYVKKNKQAEANNVKAIVDSEKQLFNR